MISKIPSLYLLSKNEVAVVSMEMHETGSPPRAVVNCSVVKWTWLHYNEAQLQCLGTVGHPKADK